MANWVEGDGQQALLPTSGSALRADPGLYETVRRIGASYGMDYCDDAAVVRMLAEHQAAVRSRGGGPLRWLGALLFVAGVFWPMPVVFGLWVPRPLDTPQGSVIAFGPSAVLLALGFALLLVVYRRDQRTLGHPMLEGYRLVLAAAKAHGVPVTHVPSWLVGRTQYTDRETAPLPHHDAAARLAERAAPMSATGGALSVPRKPAAVIEYEAIAERGGWHDEIGFLLISAGGLGIVWAYAENEPGGYAMADQISAWCGMRTTGA